MCLDFLNKYSSAITVIFTVVVALATVAYVLLTRSLVSETKKLREVQTEPKISVIIQPDERYINWINLVIQNIGLGPAYNLQFQVYPDFEEKERKFKVSEIGFIKNGLRYMAPNQKLQTFLTNTGENFEQKCEKSFTMKIAYQNAVEKTYNDEYLIDFSQQKGLREIGKPAIEKIADSAEKMEKHFQDYLSQEAERRQILQGAFDEQIQSMRKLFGREQDIPDNKTKK